MGPTEKEPVAFLFVDGIRAMISIYLEQGEVTIPITEILRLLEHYDLLEN